MTNKFCNMCSQSLYPCNNKENGPYGLVDASFTGGYYSEEMVDTHNYTFSLCEACLRTLFHQFQIKPKIERPSYYDGYLPFEEDQKIVDYHKYRSNGGLHQDYLNGICNSDQHCQNPALYSEEINSKSVSDSCACEEHKDYLGRAFNTKRIPFLPQKLRAFL